MNQIEPAPQIERCRQIVRAEIRRRHLKPVLRDVIAIDREDILEKVYRAGFKIVTLPLPSADGKPRRTFYARHGDWFGWGCVVITIAVCAVRVPLHRRR